MPFAAAFGYRAVDLIVIDQLLMDQWALATVMGDEPDASAYRLIKSTARYRSGVSLQPTIEGRENAVNGCVFLGKRFQSEKLSVRISGMLASIALVSMVILKPYPVEFSND